MTSREPVPASAASAALGRSVSIDQAARLLDVSRRTIYNRIRDGRLKTIRTLGGSQRVLVESLRENGYTPRALPAPEGAAATAAGVPAGPFIHRQEHQP